MRKFSKQLLFVVSSLLISLPILAVEYTYNSMRWYREYYSNRIAIDGENLLLATSKGLIKYNKSNGEAYNMALELYHTAEDSKFTAIETYDCDGTTIICYSIDDLGPVVYDGAKVDYYGTYFHQDDAYSFAMSHDGSVWASTIGVFIPPVDSVYHDDGIRVRNAFGAGIPGAILDMAVDSKNKLWITSYGQYNYIECHKIELYNDLWGELTGRKKITSIAIDKNDNIWYASEDGINCYYQATGQEVCMTKAQYPTMLENRYFGNDIDDSGNIWFTSENNLLKWDGSEFTTYTCDGYEEARAMLCDGDIVWVLLKNDKLLKFQNNKFEIIDLSPAVTGIEESSIEETSTKAYVSNGVLYIENAEGINSVEIYDTAGEIITSGTYNNASVQVSFPTTIKGVIMVKVNNEVLKVICE